MAATAGEAAPGAAEVRNDYPKIAVGGRLFCFRTAWKGAHFESVIKKGLSWSWEGTPPPLKLINQESSPAINRILATLRRKRVIERAKIVLFQSRIFTVPKRESTEERLILDLSILNTFIKRPRFKMLTLREIKLLLPRGFWTTSLDVKDGYWHIMVSRPKRAFLSFRWRNQDWQFRAMPFGLNVGPRIFTKVIAHVVKRMAEMGIWCLPYLDDLLIIADTEEECLIKTKLAIEILSSLGWILNEKKSRLRPAQKFEWLGVCFDLTNHTATSPVGTMQAFQLQLKRLLTAQHTSVREIMKLQGLANWIGMQDSIVRGILPKTRKMIRSLRKVGLDTPIVLGTGVKTTICRWMRGSPVPQALGSPSPDIVIQTDACLSGWGFQMDTESYYGEFDSSMTYSINVLEALTIFFSLLMVERKGVVIQILTDNTSAIAAVKKSSSVATHLSEISRLIWRRAKAFNWDLKISHIQGCYNIIADQLSRRTELPTEWSLSPEDFKKIYRLNPEIQVDLFATKLNNKLSTYVSPCPDEKAAAVDAFKTPWDRWKNLYIYPPANLISKVLAKITTFNLEKAVLVTPDTTTRPWFMSLKLMRVPSYTMVVTLQQVVVDRLVKQSQTTKLRIWTLCKEHLGRSFQNLKE